MSYSADKFVRDLKASVVKETKQAILSSLRAPSGRRPAKDLVERSNWFNDLTASDQERVSEVIRESVEMALFSTLVVLDGVDVISDELKEYNLQLVLERNGNFTVLSSTKEVVAGRELLHDLLFST